MSNIISAAFFKDILLKIFVKVYHTNPELAGEMFVGLMQEVVDNSSHELLLNTGIPVTHVIADNLPNVLYDLVYKDEINYTRRKIANTPETTSVLVNSDGYGLIAEDFILRQPGSYHYFSVRPSLGAVVANEERMIYTNDGNYDTQEQSFKEVIRHSALACNPPNQPNLIVANGYTYNGLQVNDTCQPGIGLGVQPDRSHDLCAIYAILFMLYGLEVYQEKVQDLWAEWIKANIEQGQQELYMEFCRMRQRGNLTICVNKTKAARVKNNARVALTLLYHILETNRLSDRQYTTEDLKGFGTDNNKNSDLKIAWTFFLQGLPKFSFKYSTLIKTLLHPQFKSFFNYWSDNTPTTQVKVRQRLSVKEVKGDEGQMRVQLQKNYDFMSDD